ncbi:MAG: 4-hydroxy-3-methylbut-2-enyl diphosphate reductase [Lachnospiraceae bacterium]
MEVILAKTSGFCFGVKRAVATVYEQAEKGGHIYTFGPIIHNEEVVKDLEQKGVQVLHSEKELKAVKEGTVIIRSHGVAERIYMLIEEQGLTCVDATCPFVKKIHRIVKEESEKNVQVVVIGNDNHPEVEGIKGWCSQKLPAIVIETTKEAADFTLEPKKRLCLVSQTTFNYNKFQELVEIFHKKDYDINVVNTICNATEERQTEAKEIASSADAMIVIGGMHSSNTQKLYEICRRECKNTQYIQTLADLVLDSTESISRVGITAGASTPNKIIEEVQNYVRINF